MDNEITNGLIERGNAAEQLLQSGAFQMAANALMDMYVGDILKTAPTDTISREMGYAHARAVQDIVGVLNQWVAVRDQALANDIYEDNE